MKKLNKNQKGMSLIEIVIAMAYFSAATLGVCMAFAAALKINARNMRRDNELNVQQTAIEKQQTAGVVLNDGAALDSMKISFKDGSNEVASMNKITEYKAIKTNYNSDDFNFAIKSFSSTPLGALNGTTAAKDDGKFRIYVINENANTADVTVTLNSGSIYEGDFNKGYKHASSVYFRSLAPKDASALGQPPHTEEVMPDRMLIGYYNPSLFGASDAGFSIRIKCGDKDQVIDVNNSSMYANGQMNITITAAGNCGIGYVTP